MAKVKDIIYNATFTDWVVQTETLPCGEVHEVVTTDPTVCADENTVAQYFTEHDARFVACFNPTHVALMEEVVRIALNNNPYGTCDCAGCEATHALRNYRKEVGLDG